MTKRQFDKLLPHNHNKQPALNTYYKIGNLDKVVIFFDQPIERFPAIHNVEIIEGTKNTTKIKQASKKTTVSKKQKQKKATVKKSSSKKRPAVKSGSIIKRKDVK